ncbi:hypothetical protein K0M31_012826 [Melipona bicolor]|uniref:Uncharacterized protein n=1 Tax=Melipona bicolor TaxID=60889 RepID=A0AA40KH33_9HYME|nr:hypothetical protein K0M31_012826 [Melipona bicolor]
MASGAAADPKYMQLKKEGSGESLNLPYRRRAQNGLLCRREDIVVKSTGESRCPLNAQEEGGGFSW